MEKKCNNLDCHPTSQNLIVVRLKCGYQVERGGWETLLSYYTSSEVEFNVFFQRDVCQNCKNLYSTLFIWSKIVWDLFHLLSQLLLQVNSHLVGKIEMGQVKITAILRLIHCHPQGVEDFFPGITGKLDQKVAHLSFACPGISGVLDLSVTLILDLTISTHNSNSQRRLGNSHFNGWTVPTLGFTNARWSLSSLINQFKTFSTTCYYVKMYFQRGFENMNERPSSQCTCDAVMGKEAKTHWIVPFFSVYIPFFVGFVFGFSQYLFLPSAYLAPPPLGITCLKFVWSAFAFATLTWHLSLFVGQQEYTL